MERIKQAAYECAAYLTDPACYVREFAYRIWTADALYSSTVGSLANFAAKVFFQLSLVFYAFLALFSTVPGMLLRGGASFFEKNPYIEEVAEGKTLGKDRKFTLLSWNICCVPGGYSISDGGVVPWQDRIDRVARKIIESNADVNCLYETFDAKSHIYLKKVLKQHGYTNFYTNIGARALGASSGIMVASKFKVANPEFTLFPEDTLIGQTKWAAKGVFKFDLESQEEVFATVLATHLQHSELPAYPTDEEIEARKAQMELIVEKANQINDRAVIVTGDFNLDDSEYGRLGITEGFKQDLPEGQFTWRGDEYCATLEGKKVSGPLNLDHTIAKHIKSIRAGLVETGYDPKVFSNNALSDHEGLLTTIEVH